jgi:hypothetical protein
MKKKCFVCNLEKDLSEFYKHPKMGDGYLNKCKDCCKKQATERRNQKLEQVRAYDRNRPNKKERYQKAKEYKSKMREENPEKFDKIFHGTRRRYRAKFKEKMLAESKADYAIKKGKLKRPDRCMICNVFCKPQAHHSDYSKSLDVLWLCATCHASVHKRLREQKRNVPF